MNNSVFLATTIHPLTSDNAESYSALRRQVAVDSCSGLGLTLEEELARPIQEFVGQLAAPPPKLSRHVQWRPDEFHLARTSVDTSGQEHEIPFKD
jgi:hypothetical protein